MSEGRSADYFGTFLSAVQGSQAKDPTSDASLELLRLLAETGPQTLESLHARSGVSLINFHERIRTLKEAGLVKVEILAGEQRVEATAAGRSLASLRTAAG